MCVIALAAILPMCACATVVEGTSQTITLNTEPQGAECHLNRKGKEIGAIAQTPGSVRIDKSGADITVTCTKDGYQETKVTSKSKFVGTTAGNIIAGGVIGIVVDATSGANYVYPDAVQVALAPAGAPVAATTPPAATGPAPAAQAPTPVAPAEAPKTATATAATPAKPAAAAAPTTESPATSPSTAPVTPVSTAAPAADPKKKKKIVMSPPVGH
jgi:hypothetical protein